MREPLPSASGQACMSRRALEPGRRDGDVAMMFDSYSPVYRLASVRFPGGATPATGYPACSCPTRRGLTVASTQQTG